MGPTLGGFPISFWRQFKDDVCSSGNCEFESSRCLVLLWMQHTNTFGANLAEGDCGDPVPFTAVQWFLGL